MYYVYWIKYENHTDPHTQGYIGISNNPKSRFNYHKNLKSSDNPILLRAIKKGAKLEVLKEVNSKREALLLEQQYRAINNIGWNIIPGGVCPPSQKGKKFPRLQNKNKKHSLETKQLMSLSRVGLKWWNNGKVNVRSKECPSGFISGRITNYEYKLTEEGKSNLGRAGKPVHTPQGIFNTLRDASKALNLTEDQVSYRLKKDKFVDWYYLKVTRS